MNKLFSKIAALSVGLAMAVGVGVALGHESVREVKADDTVTLTQADFSSSWTTTQGPQSGTAKGFTLETTSGLYNSAHLRQYSGATLTLTSSVGNMTSVVFTCTANGTNNYGPGKMSGDGYVASSGKTGTWTGNADSFSLTGGQSRITSIAITYSGAVVTKYSVIDRIDYGALDKDEVVEGTTLNARILPDDSYTFPESVTVLMAGSPVAYTYANGVVTVENVSGNVSIEGECPKAANPIHALYAKSSGASVTDIYGYYVGKLDNSNIVIMDGEYGIDIYKKDAFASISYIENETILKVSGSISIFNGLYEIAASSYSESTSSDVSTPEVYATKGGETAEYASRVTTVTGTATVTSGNFDDAAGKNDIKMNFTVGTQTVQVFYKKARQTADSEAFAAMKAAVEGATEITIKGFTGWYNGFQVQMTGYVKPAEGYTAEQFAQDLLDQTDAVCAGWKEGDNNHDALVAIWSNLAANDKYPSLPSDQKTILAEAERDEEGTVVEQAMARYDFLTGKYELSNFINGRTPIQSNYNFAPSFTNNNSYIIIIVISAVSVMSFGLALFLRKKRSK